MRILLTNDDGFQARGLQDLYAALAQNGKHEIYIVAPDEQRSAASRSITLFQPLFLQKYPLADQDLGFAVSGTPADCVKLAIQGKLLPGKPDLLISGINQGPNLGTDVFYSGTVGAAMEGALLGIPSLAVSVLNYQKMTDYTAEAAYIKDFVETQPIFFQKPSLAFNINFPGEGKWKGLKTTRLGRAVYQNEFEYRRTPFGKDYYWITGTLEKDEETENNDICAVHEGYISFTPLKNDLTELTQVERFERLFQETERGSSL